MKRFVQILRTGALATLQDLGRPGWAHVGVGRAGAADRVSHSLANRLVGNSASFATIEVLLGGLEFRVSHGCIVAITGAPVPVTVNGHAADHHSPVYLAPGDTVRLGMAATGLRAYVAVSGGFTDPPVLGSRSWDTMASLGPEPLAPGRRLRVGKPPTEQPTVGVAPVLLPTLDPIAVTVLPGPRDDWLADGLRPLCEGTWAVSSRSDRVGVRLEGVPLVRAPGYEDRELPSEGAVRGSIQVPSGGLPVLFLSDHPVTGGYPIVGVLEEADCDRVAQARPGQAITFRMSRGADRD